MNSAFYFPISDDNAEENSSKEDEQSNNEEAKLPLQLAIVGRPNVGKSTLLNAILQEDRVLVGPEAGLTRDSIRVEFEYEGRTIYLVSVSLSLSRSLTYSFIIYVFLPVLKCQMLFY